MPLHIKPTSLSFNLNQMRTIVCFLSHTFLIFNQCLQLSGKSTLIIAFAFSLLRCHAAFVSGHHFTSLCSCINFYNCRLDWQPNVPRPLCKTFSSKQWTCFWNNKWVCFWLHSNCENTKCTLDWLTNLHKVSNSLKPTWNFSSYIN